MSDMEEFFTRDIANEGKRVDLVHPDGSASIHWIQIRGMDSDAFRTAETKAKRTAVEVAQIDDDDKRAAAIAETELRVIAALIAGWSFEKKCTQSAVVRFLEEAPQIADMVNRYAARRAFFFSGEPTPSVDGPHQKPGSKSRRKEAKPA
jgi:hypothetical protein